MNDDILREKIIKLREEHGWSQAELARRINMNNTALNKVEKGTRKLSSSELSELASIFNVTTSNCVGDLTVSGGQGQRAADQSNLRDRRRDFVG